VLLDATKTSVHDLQNLVQPHSMVAVGNCGLILDIADSLGVLATENRITVIVISYALVTNGKTVPPSSVSAVLQ